MGVFKRLAQVDASRTLHRFAVLGVSGVIASCSATADPVPIQPGPDAHVTDPVMDARVDPMAGETSAETGSFVGPEGSPESAAADVGNAMPADASRESTVDAAMAAMDAGPAADGGFPLKYQQSFDSPTSLADLVFANPAGWQHEIVDGHGAVSLTGGSYAPPFPSPTRIAVIAVRQFGSFVLEVDVMQTGIDYGHRDACFFFGFQDPSHFYYAHVATAQDAVAHRIHIVNGAPRTSITTTSTKGFDWGRNVWKHMRVVRDIDSGLIEVYGDVDPTPVLAANNKTFGTGYIGFGSFDDTARFRNVTIYAKSTVEGPPKFFTAKP
jgi:hypothetical protein